MIQVRPANAAPSLPAVRWADLVLDRTHDLDWTRRSPGALASGVVRLWLAELDQELGELDAADWLSADELAHVARLRVPADRRRVARSRALLRGVVGRTLGVEPGAVPLERGPLGAPRAPLPLGFSLARSGPWALVAVARDASGRALGVDLERVPAEHDPVRAELLQVAEGYFHPEERRWIHAGTDPVARFLSLWTRKEAFGKAVGEGLQAALAPDAPALHGPGPRLRIADRAGGSWRCLDLALPIAARAALVVSARAAPRAT